MGRISEHHEGFIVIIENDKDHAAVLARLLALEGYQTKVAFDGQTGMELVLQTPVPDLVILEVTLPDIMGFEVCRQIRKQVQTRNIRILMLTACSGEIDRVSGFRMGCDDYLTKPYNSRELILRVKALLRRGDLEIGTTDTEFIFGCLCMDIKEHQVWVDNSPVILSTLEFRLLQNLLEHRGRLQTREVFLADVWGSKLGVKIRTVDSTVMRLREKLGIAGDYIETVPTMGYRLLGSPDESYCCHESAIN